MPQRAELSWEKWPQEAIVFNCLSGETHHLNETAALTLELLESAPQSVETVMEALTAMFDCEDAEGLRHQVRRLLEEFDRLGLAEPVG